MQSARDRCAGRRRGQPRSGSHSVGVVVIHTDRRVDPYSFLQRAGSGAGRGRTQGALADRGTHHGSNAANADRGMAMNENRKQILDMLAAGRITADEAERLLAALDPEPGTGGAQAAAGANSAKNTGPKTHPKYLRVLVEADESMTGNKGLTTVNVRVPMQLLRAGVRLAALIPRQAHNQLDSALSSHGIPLTLSQIKPENLEELIDHLEDLTVDVNGKDGNTAKVRVFCE